MNDITGSAIKEDQTEALKAALERRRMYTWCYWFSRGLHGHMDQERTTVHFDFGYHMINDITSSLKKRYRYGFIYALVDR